MRRVKKIESRVKEPSPQELAACGNWYRQFDSDRWDCQFEADALAGRLVHLVEAALERHSNGAISDL